MKNNTWGNDEVGAEINLEEQRKHVPSDVFEECVSCAKKTEVRKFTHIDYRNYYIEGAGQLCKNCFEEIYGSK